MTTTHFVLTRFAANTRRASQRSCLHTAIVDFAAHAAAASERFVDGHHLSKEYYLSGDNLSIGSGGLLRITDFDERFAIVSVAHDCRLFASMTLREEPKILVPQPALHKSQSTFLPSNSFAVVTHGTLDPS